ncbi:MAG: hypothetical protein B7Y80_01375 [Hyphomicrobium sp. 32-62-53]|nr:MAG: hypothetical protein B7Z29_01720 [Hyphomicrobium sp. 12-62-95]OYY01405.1 MAG: hypothetical protein B7Y80_01375 [Hyphomicrobium sp. 32-62-53]
MLAGGDAPAWSAPLVVVDSTMRCPDVNPSTRREFSRTTAPLKPDTVDADGKPAVSDAATKRKFDEFRTRESALIRAGFRLLEDYERCRTGSSPATS